MEADVPRRHAIDAWLTASVLIVGTGIKNIRGIVEADVHRRHVTDA